MPSDSVPIDFGDKDEWKVVLDELEQPQPKLIVHDHHNMPGLGDSYMLNEVLSPMARALQGKGCELRFTTVLREPVSELKSRENTQP